MKKTVAVLLIITFILSVTLTVGAKEYEKYDYSSFIGEWHKVDPDGLNGDIILDIQEVTDNDWISFSLDGGRVLKEHIRNNQVSWKEDWYDGTMGLTLTFYDDYIHLQYSRYSHEWYPEITFVSSMIKPMRVEYGCSVVLNDELMDFDIPPVIIGGRALVPLRTIFEKLGARVDWSAATKTVTAVKGKTKLSLTIGDSMLYVNNTPKTLDVPAMLLNGKTFVPIRAISEAFNCDIQWNPSTETVYITSFDDVLRAQSFNSLKNIIIQKGKKNTKGDYVYSQDEYSEEYDIFYYHSYRYLCDEESILLEYMDFQTGEIRAYLLILLTANGENPYALFTIGEGTGRLEIFGEFTYNYFEILNYKNISPLLSLNRAADMMYGYMSLLDSYLSTETGLSFADFGMYYKDTF